MKAITTKAAAFTIIGMLCMTVGFAIAKTAHPPVQMLLSTSRTVVGQDIVYPDGFAKITGTLITMQSGESTGWHKHNVPLFAWVMEGQVTVDYGEDGKRTYTKGDAFVEAINSYHNGKNTGGGITRILAVFAGAENIPNTVMKDN